MSNDTIVRINFNIRFASLEQLADAIKDLIYGHAGSVPLATAIGVLRIVEHEILKEQSND